MIKHLASISLILTLLITPVVSALSHCTRMDMPVNQHLTPMLDSVSQQSTDIHPNQTSEIECHATNNCSFHLCNSIGIIPSNLIINPVISFAAINSPSTPPNNINPSSLLRPPIQG